MHHISNRMRNDLSLTKSMIEFAIYIQRNPIDEEVLFDMLDEIQDQELRLSRIERHFQRGDKDVRR